VRIRLLCYVLQIFFSFLFVFYSIFFIFKAAVSMVFTLLSCSGFIICSLFCLIYVFQNKDDDDYDDDNAFLFAGSPAWKHAGVLHSGPK